MLYKQVLFTILYSDLFEFPLKVEEIESRLISSDLVNSARFLKEFKDSIKKKQISFKNLALLEEQVLSDKKNSKLSLLLQIEKVLKTLIDSDLILSYQGFYSTSPDIIKWVKERKKRKFFSEKKLEEAKKTAGFLKKMPFIQAIGITGSVSVKNAVENDDIDFLIVTKKHSLWLVRFFVTIYAFFAGKKRNQDSHIDNTWCFNLWLEEDQLAFAKSRQNLYTAYELKQITWLVDKVGIKLRIIKENHFLANFLSFFRDIKNKNFGNSSKIDNLDSDSKSSKLLEVLNIIFFKLQFWYMSKKMTNEEVSVNLAFFHPRPTKNRVLNKLWENFNKLDTHKSKKPSVLPQDIKNTIKTSKLNGKKIVLVTGVFDVLHHAHLKFLRNAQELGDILLIAIESDIRVKKMKGESRPVNNEMVRIANLVALNITPHVFIISPQFDKNQDYIDFMKAIRPDFYAVSSHTKYIDNKRQITEQFGGKLVVVLDQDKSISSSKILDSKKTLKF